MDKAFKVAVILSAYDKMSTIINQAVDKSTSKLNKLKHSMKELGERSLIAGEGGTEFFKGTVENAEAAEVAEKRVRKVFSNMLGEKGNEQAENAIKFAASYQHQIGVIHTEIEGVEAKAATFSHIIGGNAEKIQAYNRITKASYDLQATGFGNALDNAVQLGKAIQNPALGSMALSKAGALNKEDMPMIKYLQATKGLAAAQEFTLRAVEKQMKNVAVTTATETSKMNVNVTVASEAIGKNLLPAVNGAAKTISDTLVPAITDFIQKNPLLTKIIAGASVALLAFGVGASVCSFIAGGLVPVISGVSFVMKLLQGDALITATAMKGLRIAMMSTGILLIVAAIAAAAYLIYDNWGAIGKFFTWLWNGIKNVFKATWEFIKNMFLDYTPAGLIIKHWDQIPGFFSDLWDGVKTCFKIAWEGIKNLFFNYTPQGLIYSHWDEIVTYFTDIWNKVTKIFTNAWQNIKNGLTSFFGGSQTTASIAAYEKSLNAVNEKTAKVISFNAKSAVSLTSGQALTSGFAARIAGNPSTSLEAGLRPIPINNHSTINYSPVIHFNGTGSTQDAQALTTMMKSNFDKQMQEHLLQQKRRAF
jgi:hypothetical protein